MTANMEIYLSTPQHYMKLTWITKDGLDGIREICDDQEAIPHVVDSNGDDPRNLRMYKGRPCQIVPDAPHDKHSKDCMRSA